MLKAFRDNLKYLSWVLWLVIAIFVLFTFVDFGGTVPGQAPPTDAAATVDGEDITYGELQRAYSQAENTYRQAYGANFTPELARQLQLPRQVLEQLVEQRILLAEAERMGLSVSDTELQQRLLELPAFLDPNGNFVGSEDYLRILRSAGFASAEDFEEGMRSELLLGKLNQILGNNIVISDEEVEQAYREEAEQAQIDFVRIPLAQFRSDDDLAAEEVEAFFQDNLSDFRLPERRSVEYLLIDPEVVRQGLEVSEEELRAYYTEHLADYEREEQVRARQILLQVNDSRTEEQAQQELEAIRARVAAGEDFAQLATELSEDTFTAPRGGEMDPFGRGQILPEVEEAAFAAQPGDVIGPIRSTVAYHLLQILDHTPGGAPPFEALQATLEQRVLAERSRDAADAKVTEIADRVAREEIVSAAGLEQLAESDPAVSFRTTQAFGRSDNVATIGRSTPFSEAAFQLEANGVSNPVRVGAAWAILHLSDIEEPRDPELAEVEADVRTRLRDMLAREAGIARMAAAREEILAGGSLEDVASSFELTVEQSGRFNSAGQVGASIGANRDLAVAALALEAGDVGEVVVIGNDVVLYRVSERIHVDPATFATAKEAKRNELAGQRLFDLLASVIAERREELDIEYDPQMAANLGLAG